eukprot:Platyproteum_vivax@DN7053_c0_g1_i1.p2
MPCPMPCLPSLPPGQTQASSSSRPRDRELLQRLPALPALPPESSKPPEPESDRFLPVIPVTAPDLDLVSAIDLTGDGDNIDDNDIHFQTEITVTGKGITGRDFTG